MRILFACTSLMLFVAMAIPAAAQRYERPPGSFHAALHLGGGWGKADIKGSGGSVISETETQLGGFWGFRVGTALTEVLALSVDYFGYASVDDEPGQFDRLESEFWVIGPALSWYPMSGGGYLKFLAGWGGVTLTAEADGERARADERNLGLLGSIGYEIPLNPRLSLGAQADYVWMKVDEVLVSGGSGGRQTADFGFYTWGFSLFVLMNY